MRFNVLLKTNIIKYKDKTHLLKNETENHYFSKI